MSGPSVSRPPLEPVSRLIREMRSRGAVVSVGGSALLAWLGLISEVRDWDLVVEADEETVSAAIAAAGLVATDVTRSDGAYASRRCLRLDGGTYSIDVIVDFCLRRGETVVRLPGKSIGEWHGLPMGDPEVWRTAYELLGRHDRAALLAGWLSTAGRS